MRKTIGRFLRKNMMGVYRIYEKIFWTIVEKRKNKGLHKLGYTYLNQIEVELEKAGIKSFITYGTLLGIIREGKFIGHDSDIDIGVIYDSSFSWERLENVLNNVGMKKKHQFVLDGNITEQTYICGELSIDFFLFYQYDNEQQVAYAYFRKPDETYEDDSFEVSRNIVPAVKEIKKNENEKGCFLIPQNAEEFLEKVYGKNWKIPDPNWQEDMDVVKGKVAYIERNDM